MQNQVRNENPTPIGKDGLHPFTRLAFWASVAGFAVNLAIAASFLLYFPLFVSMSLDNLFVMGILAMAVFGPGLHGLIKARAPGESLLEKRLKPKARDVRRILLSFGIMSINLAVALLFAYWTTSMMTGRR